MKKSVIPPIKDLVLKWYKSKCESKSKPLSLKTKRALKIYWKFITEKLGKYKLSEITHEMMDKLVESVVSGESNATRKHYLRHVRMFFNWCIKHRLIRENPTVGPRVGRAVAAALAATADTKGRKGADAPLPSSVHPRKVGECVAGLTPNIGDDSADNNTSGVSGLPQGGNA